MSLKIENGTHSPLPHSMLESLESMIRVVPREHLKGLGRLVIVNSIENGRARALSSAELPGLYHPKQGPQSAWIEVALDALLHPKTSLFKKFAAKISFKSNLAALLFSLIGQHHYLTLRHSIKRTQLEPAVRAYASKYLSKWGAERHKLRTRLLKPLQPTLEKWARSLHKSARRNKGGR
jgi:hypothetical protein